jgi:hypothetical protein
LGENKYANVASFIQYILYFYEPKRSGHYKQ